MLLNLQGIYKSYGGTIEVPVLKNISFQVAEGEYVALWVLLVQGRQH